MVDMSDETFQPAPSSVARPFVLLWHQGGLVEDHVDWLCATDADGSGPLQTWRIATRIDSLDTGGSTVATPIAMHRPRYLDYEGPISDGRGTVRRIARGHAWDASNPIDEGTLLLQWTDGPAAGRWQQVQVLRPDDGSWILHCSGWNA